MDSNDGNKEPQWGQAMTAAEQTLRVIAADVDGRLDRDALGRLVLVHDHP